MPDDDKKPPPGSVPIVRISERASPRALHRDHTRPRSSGEALFVEEEFTDQYEIGSLDEDELRRRRNTRDTKDRLTRLEEKHDGIAASVTRLESSQAVTDGKVDKLTENVADMGGQFKVIPKLVETMENAISALQQREHVKFTATVDVDKAKAMGEIEAVTEERKTEAHIKKSKWDIIAKVVAVIATIATVISTSIAAGC